MTSKDKKQSQRAYLAKRDALIEGLYLREGDEPRDIATKMLADETIRSESEESAIRTVRSVVAKIRKRIDLARSDDAKIETATNEVDALERKLQRLRADHVWQLARSEDASTTMHVMSTPNGEVVIEKANWPAGVRQKARKDASILAEKIADLELVLASKRSLESEKGGERASEGGGLTIIESDMTIAELIEKNLRVN